MPIAENLRQTEFAEAVNAYHQARQAYFQKRGISPDGLKWFDNAFVNFRAVVEFDPLRPLPLKAIEALYRAAKAQKDDFTPLKITGMDIGNTSFVLGLKTNRSEHDVFIFNIDGNHTPNLSINGFTNATISPDVIRICAELITGLAPQDGIQRPVI